MGLDPYRDAGWGEIAGGFKTRFELAKALVWDPRLLILDEPLAPLDVNTLGQFLKDLRGYASSLRFPLAVLISSQHLYETEWVADRLIFLKDGKATFQGSPWELGTGRAENWFELSCPSTPDIPRRLTGMGVQSVQNMGHCYLLKGPLALDGAVLLEGLLKAGVEVRYFRDVSRSSRKFFETKGTGQ